MPNENHAGDMALGMEQLGQVISEQADQLDKQKKATAFLAEMCALLLHQGNHVSPETQCIITADAMLAMEGWEIAMGTSHDGSEQYLFVKPPNATKATEQEMIDASRKKPQQQPQSTNTGLYGLDGKPITR